MRIHIFNFIFAVLETLHFEWFTIDLSAETKLGIPKVESSLSTTKLLTVLLKSSSIEIRVDLDFLYKDIIAAYNNILNPYNELTFI